MLLLQELWDGGKENKQRPNKRDMKNCDCCALGDCSAHSISGFVVMFSVFRVQFTTLLRTQTEPKCFTYSSQVV